jgi:hypothetical protein
VGYKRYSGVIKRYGKRYGPLLVHNALLIPLYDILFTNIQAFIDCLFSIVTERRCSSKKICVLSYIYSTVAEFIPTTLKGTSVMLTLQSVTKRYEASVLYS